MKYEIRIFAGSQGKPRRSKNFTIDSALSLYELSQKAESALKSHDMPPARKASDVEPKEGM